MAEGIVTRLHGRIAYVSDDGCEFACEVRGKLKRGRRTARSPVAVGDRVTFEPLPGGAGAIEAVHPRKGELCRPSPHNPRIKQLIAANVETLAIVIGADQVEAQLPTLDRLLATAYMQNLAPAIVVNKLDLAERDAVQAELAAYEKFGVPVLFTSAVTGRGLAELRQLLLGRVTAFAGPSGVGKSSLLNALRPALALRIREVSRRGEGRHTTTRAALLPVAGGWVVDTPGIREFGLWELELGELSLFYPDFAPYRERCRYGGCTHRHEPGCAVKAAVEGGDLDGGRYKRYLELLREAWNTQSRRRF